MDTNRYFSFTRLGYVMKRDWMENWKTNLYTFLGIFLAYLLVYLTQMNGLNSSHAGYYYSEEQYEYEKSQKRTNLDENKYSNLSFFDNSDTGKPF